MDKRSIKKAPVFLMILGLSLLMAAAAGAQEKWQTLSLKFLEDGFNGYSALDRSRILKGLMYSAGCLPASSGDRTAWTSFAREKTRELVEGLPPSKEEEALETMANILEIGPRLPDIGLEPKLQEWKRFFLSPRFMGPESPTDRLGVALVILHARPEPAALKFAETLIESVIESIRYENEMHRFPAGPDKQAFAHRILRQISRAPVQTVHQRKIAWILVTNYKYISRMTADRALPDSGLVEALLGHGLLHHGSALGEKLAGGDPAPLDLPAYYSVIARYAHEKKPDSEWIARAKSRTTPRLVLTSGQWTKMIARNRTPRFSEELRKTIDRAEDAMKLDVPVYYEPAPNLEERGKTNDKSIAVGRKMSPLKAAFLATGGEKYGKAYKDVVMAQVKQFEDYGDFRCYYNLNVPGPWDGLGAVVTYTRAYDILTPKGLLSDEEQTRIIRMIREIGRELEWTVTYSNFVVHNAWARWIGSLGFLASYWSDMPEADSWASLAESRLPFLYSGIDKDGGWFEKTLNYHLFTMDMPLQWFSAVQMLQGKDLFAKELNGRSLDMMLDWIIKITPPGGELPLFNDGEKLNLKNSGVAVDMARILRRGDFFKAANFPPNERRVDEPEIPRIELRKPAFDSILLEESGYGVFRSGWEPGDDYFAIKFGAHGGGHGHYDKASIYFHAHDRPWLIDPGYGQNETYKHNTVLVDGKNQDEAEGRLIAWHEGPAVNLVSVGHSAYTHIEHTRTALYVKPGTILLVDRLVPSDGLSHDYDWSLQFNSDSGTSGKTSWTSAVQNSGIRVTFPENDGEGTREFASALNVNELPSNYHRMDNDNLYLRIWRGKWSKRSDKPVVFAALIDAFKNKDVRGTLSQKDIQNGLELEFEKAGKTHSFTIRWDGHYSYRGPDGKEVDMK